MNQLSYVAFIQWLLRHLAAVPALAAKATAIWQASGLPDRWSAIKLFGDDLVPILDDFPWDGAGVEPLDVAALEAAEATITAQGIDLAKLKQLFEVVSFLLPLLKQLFGK